MFLSRKDIFFSAKRTSDCYGNDRLCCLFCHPNCSTWLKFALCTLKWK